MSERQVFRYNALSDGVPAFPKGMVGVACQPFPELGKATLRTGTYTGGKMPWLKPIAGLDPRMDGLVFCADKFLNQDAREHPDIKPHLPPLKGMAVDWNEKALMMRAQVMSPNLKAALNLDAKKPAYLGEQLHSMPYGVNATEGRIAAVMKCSNQPGSFLHWWLCSFGLRNDLGQFAYYEPDVFEGSGRKLIQGTFTQHGIPEVDSRGKTVELGFDRSLRYAEYGMNWNRDSIRWTVDNKVVCEDEKPAHFKEGSRLFFILGLSVGNQSYIQNGKLVPGWAGPPDATDKFPYMQWVRSISAFEPA